MHIQDRQMYVPQSKAYIYTMKYDLINQIKLEILNIKMNGQFFFELKIISDFTS